MEQKNNNDFMIEKIKERPVNKRKLLKRTLTTALMAVMFGLIACFTFLVLEPVISNWLYPEPEEEKLVLFPEEQEEMEPEDMLSDNLPEATAHPFLTDKDQEEKMEEFLGNITLDYNHYAQLYSSLSEVVETLNKYMVTITATKTNKDWLSNEYETHSETMGVAIGNTGREILILTDYESVKNADALEIRLSNGSRFEVQMEQYHTNSDIAILSVSLTTLGEAAEEIYIASFGSSNTQNLLCAPVIAMGCPMGECETVGYGIITSEKGQVTMVDANYKLLMTDIYGSQKASGFLFNLKGQIIGIITDKKTSSDMRNMIAAYGITDLKKLISKLSSGSQVAYMGITGIDVSDEASEEGKLPVGVYVQDVEENSPALHEGVQRGDVIVGLGNKVISNYREYASALGDLTVGSTVTLRVKRLSQGEYTEMFFDILLEAAD